MCLGPLTIAINFILLKLLFFYHKSNSVYVCIYTKGKDFLHSPRPSHSLPEETIVFILCGSLQKSQSHALSYLIFTVLSFNI